MKLGLKSLLCKGELKKKCHSKYWVEMVRSSVPWLSCLGHLCKWPDRM